MQAGVKTPETSADAKFHQWEQYGAYIYVWLTDLLFWWPPPSVFWWSCFPICAIFLPCPTCILWSSSQKHSGIFKAFPFLYSVYVPWFLYLIFRLVKVCNIVHDLKPVHIPNVSHVPQMYSNIMDMVCHQCESLAQHVFSKLNSDQYVSNILNSFFN
jgi:hypothetical protein